jgi:hypothetical protein
MLTVAKAPGERLPVVGVKVTPLIPVLAFQFILPCELALSPKVTVQFQPPVPSGQLLTAVKLFGVTVNVGPAQLQGTLIVLAGPLKLNVVPNGQTSLGTTMLTFAVPLATSVPLAGVKVMPLPPDADQFNPVESVSPRLKVAVHVQPWLALYVHSLFAVMLVGLTTRIGVVAANVVPFSSNRDTTISIRQARLISHLWREPLK